MEMETTTSSEITVSSDERLLWKPSKKQKLALECPAFEVFFGGARFGGKTDWMLIDFLRGVKYGENHKGILFRRSYPEFEEIVFRSKQLYSQIGAHYTVTQRTWTFKGGATLKLRYLESDKDVEQYQGHSYTWIGFDELPNWETDYCYKYMFSCARSAVGVPVSIRSTGNPGTVGQAWVKARFVDPVKPYMIYHDPQTSLTRCFIPSFLEDNPKAKNDPEYEMRLRNLPDYLYQAHRFGKWDVLGGQAFSVLHGVHVIDRIEIPKNAPIYFGFDWGFGKPYAAVWMFSDLDGNLYQFAELYGWNGKPNEGVRHTDSQIVNAIKEVEKRLGIQDRKIIRVLSHDCFNKKPNYSGGGLGTSTADVFAASGIAGSPNKPDRKLKIRQMRQRLYVDENTGKPSLFFFSDCKQTIRTLNCLVVDPSDPEDIDTKGEDHLYDAICNVLMFNPVKAKPVKIKKNIYDIRLEELEKPQRTLHVISITDYKKSLYILRNVKDRKLFQTVAN